MQFLLYCLCGGAGVSADYGVYYFSVTHGLWYQGANALGYLTGMLVSFSLNRVVTFGMRDSVLQRFVSFAVVAGVGFLTSALMLWFLIDSAGVDSRIAKLMTLPVVLILQYTLNRKFTFAPEKTGGE